MEPPASTEDLRIQEAVDMFRLLDSGGDGMIDLHEFVSGMVNTAQSGVENSQSPIEVLRASYEAARDAARKNPKNEDLWRKYENAFSLLQRSQGAGQAHMASLNTEASGASSSRKSRASTAASADDEDDGDDEFAGVTLELTIRNNERWLFASIVLAWLGTWAMVWYYYKVNLRKCNFQCVDQKQHMELLDPGLRSAMGTQEWVCILCIPSCLILYFLMRWVTESVKLKGPVITKFACFIIISICTLAHSRNIYERYQWIEVSEGTASSSEL